MSSNGSLVPTRDVCGYCANVKKLRGLGRSSFTDCRRCTRTGGRFRVKRFFAPRRVYQSVISVLYPISSRVILSVYYNVNGFFGRLPGPRGTCNFSVSNGTISITQCLCPRTRVRGYSVQRCCPRRHFSIVVNGPPFGLGFSCGLSRRCCVSGTCSILGPTKVLVIVIPYSFVRDKF